MLDGVPELLDHRLAFERRAARGEEGIPHPDHDLCPAPPTCLGELTLIERGNDLILEDLHQFTSVFLSRARPTKKYASQFRRSSDEGPSEPRQKRANHRDHR